MGATITAASRRKCKRWTSCLVLMAGLWLGLPAPAIADKPPWPEASFTYVADRQPLAELLRNFARSFGLEAALSQMVGAIPDLVSGKFTTVSPSEFMDQLGATYSLTWFAYDGTLYVSRSSERSTKVLRPPGVSVASLKQALIELGVFETKFGWGEIPDRGMALISGPPAYVELLERVVTVIPPLEPDQTFQMFRLRHAQVDDRVITFRDRQITTYGVASILRGLATGDSSRGGTSVTLMEMAAPLRPLTPLASSSTPDAADNSRAGNASAGANGAGAPARPGTPGPGRLQAVIQADSRLNAVIVRDRPENMPIYRDLVAILDVPSKLVEIEAMIVDVNASHVAELGFDWQLRSSRLAAGFGSPAADAGAAANAAIGIGVNPSTLAATATTQLLARIRALETQGNARIVSRPSILTMDNLGALIDLSDTFYIQSVGERVSSVVPISVGISLRVTPRIIEEDGRTSVQLTVDIEDGVIQDASNQSLPRVRRSTIGTQAIMGAHESLLIGGFNSEQDVVETSAVPVLSEIPIIGALFRNTSTSVGKRERLFLITPRIVPLPGGTTQAAQDAAAPNPLHAQAANIIRQQSAAHAPGLGGPVQAGPVPAGPVPRPAPPVAIAAPPGAASATRIRRQPGAGPAPAPSAGLTSTVRAAPSQRAAIPALIISLPPDAQVKDGAGPGGAVPQPVPAQNLEVRPWPEQDQTAPAPGAMGGEQMPANSHSQISARPVRKSAPIPHAQAPGLRLDGRLDMAPHVSNSPNVYPGTVLNSQPRP